MNASKINELAHRITRELFKNGAGQQASRLVFEWDDGNRLRNLGEREDDQPKEIE